MTTTKRPKRKGDSGAAGRSRREGAWPTASQTSPIQSSVRLT